MRLLVPLAVAFLVALPARADKVDELVRLLRHDPSYKVRVEAALVLRNLGDPRAVPALVDALGDSSDAVRVACASALGHLGDRRAVTPLERLKNDHTLEVREAAKRALVELGPDSTGGARFVVAVHVTGRAPADAARAFGESLTRAVAAIPRVATVPAGARAGYAVETTITRIAFAGGELDCDVQAQVTTLPGRAIKATATAGAAVSGATGATDAGAIHDCLDGAATQLAEEVGQYFARMP